MRTGTCGRAGPRPGRVVGQAANANAAQDCGPDARRRRPAVFARPAHGGRRGRGERCAGVPAVFAPGRGAAGHDHAPNVDGKRRGPCLPGRDRRAQGAARSALARARSPGVGGAKRVIARLRRRRLLRGGGAETQSPSGAIRLHVLHRSPGAEGGAPQNVERGRTPGVRASAEERLPRRACAPRCASNAVRVRSLPPPHVPHVPLRVRCCRSQEACARIGAGDSGRQAAAEHDEARPPGHWPRGGRA